MEILMVPDLMPIDRCAEISGLRSHEIVLGVSPCAKHDRLLSRYNRDRGRDAARAMIVADIRNALEFGSTRRAADLLVVLRRLLAKRDANARYASSRNSATSRETPVVAPRRARAGAARARLRVLGASPRFERRQAPGGVNVGVETDNVLSFEAFSSSRRG
jgi:hypothetical protein